MTITDTRPTSYVPADTAVDEWRSEAVQLTADNARDYLKGLPAAARLGVRAAMQLPKGSLTVRMPDGRLVRIGGKAPGPDAVLLLANWDLARRAMTASTIGVGESYMDGDWDSPDLTTFLELFLVNEEAGHDVARQNRLFQAIHGFLHWLNRNTPSRAKRNISAHYDLGNAFYRRWLDGSMTYSSALFAEGANDLESAQTAKYRALARATGIGPDDHVLEIGCGWGGFAEFAAREIGCRVTGLTISQEQLDYARDRIQRAGLSDRVALQFRDYREETGLYDKVVSIEMIEAVGRQYWPTFFAKLRDVVKPGGRIGLQAITIAENAYPEYRDNPDFIQRYIFPGGVLPTAEIVRRHADDHALETVDERAFGQDYARTLDMWRERFQSAWDSIAPLGFDERFRRMWEFYLHYCAAGFRQERINVRQMVFARA